MNPQNGKGSGRLHARQQCTSEKMTSNWDLAFSKKTNDTNNQKKENSVSHLMIDLETLGTTPEAPVLSIGAAFFDPNTSGVFSTFHEKIDFESACNGRELCASTVKWWLGQCKEAQTALLSGDTVSQSKALSSFLLWVVDNCPDVKKVKPWGNGATFDISILESLLTANNMVTPWEFYNVRDVRTIVECANPLVKRDSVPFEGVKHDALADALHQVKYVSAMWQALRKSK